MEGMEGWVWRVWRVGVKRVWKIGMQRVGVWRVHRLGCRQHRYFTHYA